MSPPVDALLIMPPPSVATPLATPIAPPEGSDSSGSSPPSRKRRRSSVTTTAATSNAVTAAMPSTTSNGRARSASGAPLSATHELRLLRSQVASMEEHLRALRSQWTATLPDSTTRAAARQAAGEKRLALLHERDHDALEATLRQQQLAFAALQSAVRRAPLFSRGQEIYDALHLDTSLGRDPLERAEQLQQHFERSMASVPSHVERLSTLELSDKAESKSTPQSKVSITGGENYTLVSSVFMAEIPHPSLDLVFAATRAYLQGLPSAVKRHVGANMDRKKMSCDSEGALSARGLLVEYRRTTISSPDMSSTANTVVCAAIRDGRGVFHVDTVADDALHPFLVSETPRRAHCGLTITPRVDPGTQQPVAMTLRLVIVYRYERLPQDPVIERELRSHRSILNGDLLISAVVKFLQDHPDGLNGSTSNGSTSNGSTSNGTSNGS